VPAQPQALQLARTEVQQPMAKLVPWPQAVQWPVAGRLAAVQMAAAAFARARP
jgi:hypothetical protein